ncbi:MAG: hypothetical protein U0S50_13395 [Sphingopyxis sp.]|uniref:hypothetical protein n=1 Tax=Sphingopyxis sp. TaxID=1908224 RepID=UPI002AB916F7|nr:hypothetical protein [Sphingopyxis sp.]MDZ3832790.1 hypothetical protein [Sphingopyxis sp.]
MPINALENRAPVGVPMAVLASLADKPSSGAIAQAPAATETHDRRRCPSDRSLRKYNLRTATFFAAGMSLAVSAAPAWGQDRVYAGPGTDWTSAANWSGSDAADSASETAVFQNNGAPTNITISSNVPAAGVRFDAGAPARTINVRAFLSLFGAGINNQSGAIQTINIDGAVQGSTTLQLANASDIVGTQTNIRVGNGFMQIAQQANATMAHVMMDGGILSLETNDGTATVGALSGDGRVQAISANGAIANQQLTVGGTEPFDGVFWADWAKSWHDGGPRQGRHRHADANGREHLQWHDDDKCRRAADRQWEQLRGAR